MKPPFRYHTREPVNSDGFTFTAPNVATGNKYITVHMGSMGYYDAKFQPGGLKYEEPQIGQVMMNPVGFPVRATIPILVACAAVLAGAGFVLWKSVIKK